jgi:protein-disulfide isomerase
MLTEYSGKVKWVYRHYPLDQIHPDARPAANASECVFAEKGEDAFWAFIDKIFEDQARLKELDKIASEVGVDKSAFRACLNAKKYDSKITEQQDGGTKAGVTGTPGNFLLDGKGKAYIIPGAVSYATIKSLIEKALGN